MENPEEILHCLEEFSKSKPNDIPRELEEYLCFVAKTGDPVYQWSSIKSLLREKMIRVITEFYEACPSVEIPPCPNVDIFNYDVMKNFILEKLDTFAAAPFTVQRICELLTTPRKEYNRIDKYMRALEKNILVVSTTEPGGRRNTENGDGIVNGLELEHLPETSNSSSDINVEEMDYQPPTWSRLLQNDNNQSQQQQQQQHQQSSNINVTHEQETTTATTTTTTTSTNNQIIQETIVTESKNDESITCTSSTQDTVITCRNDDTYVSIEPVSQNNTNVQEEEHLDTDHSEDSNVSVTITAIPAGVQKRRNSVEPVVSSDNSEQIAAESSEPESSDNSNELKEEDSKTRAEEAEESSSTEETKDADSSGLQDEQQKEDKSEEIEEESLSNIENDQLTVGNEADNVENDEETKDIDGSGSKTTVENEDTIEKKGIEVCSNNEEITSSDNSVVECIDNIIKSDENISESSSSSSSIDNVESQVSDDTQIVATTSDEVKQQQQQQDDGKNSPSTESAVLPQEDEQMEVDEINKLIDDDDDDNEKTTTTTSDDSTL